MKRELVKAIQEKEIQLAKLKEHVDKSSVCSDLYNKVVLEKAVLKRGNHWKEVCIIKR